MKNWQEKLGKYTIYYRSKFSRDCSRGETEKECSTEMMAVDDVIQLLSDQEQETKEKIRENCDLLPGLWIKKEDGRTFDRIHPYLLRNLILKS